MSYPVGFEMDYVKRRSRLTTFFRYILAIPQFVFAWFYAIAFYVVLIIAWFALLFTGRWPRGLYGFAGGFLRYITRFSAYFFWASISTRRLAALRTTAILSASTSRRRWTDTAA